jgi:thiol-disulfide isomerase/thioredoxin
MLIGIAEAEAARKNGSLLPMKTIEEITAFVNSEQCSFTAEKKKQLTDILSKYAKTSIGGDLALYGKTLEDKDFDWASLRGKVVLVLFTADWCAPCRDALPALRSAYDKYKAKGFEIVSVYIGEKKDGDVQRFVTDEKLPWVIVSETLTKKSGKPEQSEEYMVSQVPTMFLTAKDGRTLEQIPTAEVLNAKLAALLGE